MDDENELFHQAIADIDDLNIDPKLKLELKKEEKTVNSISLPNGVVPVGIEKIFLELIRAHGVDDQLQNITNNVAPEQHQLSRIEHRTEIHDLRSLTDILQVLAPNKSDLIAAYQSACGVAGRNMKYYQEKQCFKCPCKNCKAQCKLVYIENQYRIQSYYRITVLNAVVINMKVLTCENLMLLFREQGHSTIVMITPIMLMKCYRISKLVKESWIGIESYIYHQEKNQWKRLLSILYYLQKQKYQVSILLYNNDEPITDLKKIVNNDEIYYVRAFAITPIYSEDFVKSSCFTGVYMIDGTHFKSVAGGVIICCGTPLPNNNILPVTFGWGASEGEYACKLVCEQAASLAGENLQTVFADEGKGLNAAIEQHFPKEKTRQCSYHLSHKASMIHVASLIEELFNSKHPMQWDEIFTKIIEKIPNDTDMLETLERNNIFNYQYYDCGFTSTAIQEAWNAHFKTDEKFDIAEAVTKFVEGNRTAVHEVERGYIKARSLDENILFIRNQIYNMSSGISILSHSTEFYIYVQYYDRVYQLSRGKYGFYECTCNFHNRIKFPCCHLIAAAIKTDHINVDDLKKYLHPRFDHSKYKNDLQVIFDHRIDLTRVGDVKATLDPLYIKCLSHQADKRYKSPRE